MAHISKRTRFEIFKRDGFTCQYCNRKPPDVTLEVDHIDPRAAGGSNAEINLVTACFDCNRGKSDKKLHSTHGRPDADLEFLACAQEIAEAKRFLQAQAELHDIREELIGEIQDHWNRSLQMKGSVPAEHVILEWVKKYSPDEIVKAIDCFVPQFRRTPWKFQEAKGFTDAVKYVSGIMRNRRDAA